MTGPLGVTGRGTSTTLEVDEAPPVVTADPVVPAVIDPARVGTTPLVDGVDGAVRPSELSPDVTARPELALPSVMTPPPVAEETAPPSLPSLPSPIPTELARDVDALAALADRSRAPTRRESTAVLERLRAVVERDGDLGSLVLVYEMLPQTSFSELLSRLSPARVREEAERLYGAALSRIDPRAVPIPVALEDRALEDDAAITAWLAEARVEGGPLHDTLENLETTIARLEARDPPFEVDRAELARVIALGITAPESDRLMSSLRDRVDRSGDRQAARLLALITAAQAELHEAAATRARADVAAAEAILADSSVTGPARDEAARRLAVARSLVTAHERAERTTRAVSRTVYLDAREARLEAMNRSVRGLERRLADTDPGSPEWRRLNDRLLTVRRQIDDMSEALRAEIDAIAERRGGIEHVSRRSREIAADSTDAVLDADRAARTAHTTELDTATGVALTDSTDASGVVHVARDRELPPAIPDLRHPPEHYESEAVRMDERLAPDYRPRTAAERSRRRHHYETVDAAEDARVGEGEARLRASGLRRTESEIAAAPGPEQRDGVTPLPEEVALDASLTPAEDRRIAAMEVLIGDIQTIPAAERTPEDEARLRSLEREISTIRIERAAEREEELTTRAELRSVTDELAYVDRVRDICSEWGLVESPESLEMRRRAAAMAPGSDGLGALTLDGDSSRVDAGMVANRLTFLEERLETTRREMLGATGDELARLRTDERAYTTLINIGTEYRAARTMTDRADDSELSIVARDHWTVGETETADLRAAASRDTESVDVASRELHDLLDSHDDLLERRTLLRGRVGRDVDNIDSGMTDAYRSGDTSRILAAESEATERARDAVGEAESSLTRRRVTIEEAVVPADPEAAADHHAAASEALFALATDSLPLVDVAGRVARDETELTAERTRFEHRVPTLTGEDATDRAAITRAVSDPNDPTSLEAIGEAHARARSDEGYARRTTARVIGRTTEAATREEDLLAAVPGEEARARDLAMRGGVVMRATAMTVGGDLPDLALTELDGARERLHAAMEGASPEVRARLEQLDASLSLAGATLIDRARRSGAERRGDEPALDAHSTSDLRLFALEVAATPPSADERAIVDASRDGLAIAVMSREELVSRFGEELGGRIADMSTPERNVLAAEAEASVDLYSASRIVAHADRMTEALPDALRAHGRELEAERDRTISIIRTIATEASDEEISQTAFGELMPLVEMYYEGTESLRASELIERVNAAYDERVSQIAAAAHLFESGDESARLDALAGLTALARGDMRDSDAATLMRELGGPTHALFGVDADHAADLDHAAEDYDRGYATWLRMGGPPDPESTGASDTSPPVIGLDAIDSRTVTLVPRADALESEYHARVDEIRDRRNMDATIHDLAELGIISDEAAARAHYRAFVAEMPDWLRPVYMALDSPAFRRIIIETIVIECATMGLGSAFSAATGAGRIAAEGAEFAEALGTASRLGRLGEMLGEARSVLRIFPEAVESLGGSVFTRALYRGVADMLQTTLIQEGARRTSAALFGEDSRITQAVGVLSGMMFVSAADRVARLSGFTERILMNVGITTISQALVPGLLEWGYRFYIDNSGELTAEQQETLARLNAGAGMLAGIIVPSIIGAGRAAWGAYETRTSLSEHLPETMSATARADFARGVDADIMALSSAHTADAVSAAGRSLLERSIAAGIPVADATRFVAREVARRRSDIAFEDPSAHGSETARLVEMRDHLAADIGLLREAVASLPPADRAAAEAAWRAGVDDTMAAVLVEAEPRVRVDDDLSERVRSLEERLVALGYDVETAHSASVAAVSAGFERAVGSISPGRRASTAETVVAQRDVLEGLARELVVRRAETMFTELVPGDAAEARRALAALREGLEPLEYMRAAEAYLVAHGVDPERARATAHTFALQIARNMAVAEATRTPTRGSPEERERAVDERAEAILREHGLDAEPTTTRDAATTDAPDSTVMHAGGPSRGERELAAWVGRDRIRNVESVLRTFPAEQAEPLRAAINSALENLSPAERTEMLHNLDAWLGAAGRGEHGPTLIPRLTAAFEASARLHVTSSEGFDALMAVTDRPDPPTVAADASPAARERSEATAARVAEYNATVAPAYERLLSTLPEMPGANGAVALALLRRVTDAVSASRETAGGLRAPDPEAMRAVLEVIRDLPAADARRLQAAITSGTDSMLALTLVEHYAGALRDPATRGAALDALTALHHIGGRREALTLARRLTALDAPPSRDALDALVREIAPGSSVERLVDRATDTTDFYANESYAALHGEGRALTSSHPELASVVLSDLGELPSGLLRPGDLRELESLYGRLSPEDQALVRDRLAAISDPAERIAAMRAMADHWFAHETRDGVATTREMIAAGEAMARRVHAPGTRAAALSELAAAATGHRRAYTGDLPAMSESPLLRSGGEARRGERSLVRREVGLWAMENVGEIQAAIRRDPAALDALTERFRDRLIRDAAPRTLSESELAAFTADIRDVLRNIGEAEIRTLVPGVRVLIPPGFDPAFVDAHLEVLRGMASRSSASLLVDNPQLLVIAPPGSRSIFELFARAVPGATGVSGETVRIGGASVSVTGFTLEGFGGEAPGTTAVHEFGHILDSLGAIRARIDGREVSLREFVTSYLADHGRDIASSTYGTTNAAEFTAEAIRDYMGYPPSEGAAPSTSLRERAPELWEALHEFFGDPPPRPRDEATILTDAPMPPPTSTAPNPDSGVMMNLRSSERSAEEVLADARVGVASARRSRREALGEVVDWVMSASAGGRADEPAAFNDREPPTLDAATRTRVDRIIADREAALAATPAPTGAARERIIATADRALRTALSSHLRAALSLAGIEGTRADQMLARFTAGDDVPAVADAGVPRAQGPLAIVEAMRAYIADPSRPPDPIIADYLPATTLVDGRPVVTPEAYEAALRSYFGDSDPALVERVIRAEVYRAPDPAAFEALLASDPTVPTATGTAELTLGSPGLRARLLESIAAMRADPEVGPSIAGLSDAQALALVGYTQSDYEALNFALRSDPESAAALAPYIDQVRSALEALPARAGETYRTITLNEADVERLFPADGTFSDPAFMSTRLDPESSRDGNVHITIEGTSGREIPLSHWGNEGEVLFPPGARFRVAERTFDEASGEWTIRLEEVHDAAPSTVEDPTWRARADEHAASSDRRVRLPAEIAIALAATPDTHITAFETPVLREDGTRAAEIDIRTEHAIIEVTVGDAENKLRQINERLRAGRPANPDGLPVILVATDISPARAAAISSPPEVYVVRTTAEALQLHARLRAGASGEATGPRFGTTPDTPDSTLLPRHGRPTAEDRAMMTEVRAAVDLDRDVGPLLGDRRRQAFNVTSEIITRMREAGFSEEIRQILRLEAANGDPHDTAELRARALMSLRNADTYGAARAMFDFYLNDPAARGAPASPPVTGGEPSVIIGETRTVGTPVARAPDAPRALEAGRQVTIGRDTLDVAGITPSGEVVLTRMDRGRLHARSVSLTEVLGAHMELVDGHRFLATDGDHLSAGYAIAGVESGRIILFNEATDSHVTMAVADFLAANPWALGPESPIGGTTTPSDPAVSSRAAAEWYRAVSEARTPEERAALTAVRDASTSPAELTANLAVYEGLRSTPERLSRIADELAPHAAAPPADITATSTAEPTSRRATTPETTTRIMDAITARPPARTRPTEAPIPPIDAAFIRAHGLEPTTTITVAGHELHLSAPFSMGEGRIGVLAYVENPDGTVSIRSFYRSNSQGQWHSASHFGEPMGNPMWIGKGNGEHTTSLPIEAQVLLNEHAASADTVALSADDGNRAFYGPLEYIIPPADYMSSMTGSGPSVVPAGTPWIDRDGAIHTEGAPRPGTRSWLHPESFRFPPGMEPVFTSPERHYTVDLPMYGGPVDAFVYPSANGEARYLFYHDPRTGRAWVAQVERTSVDLTSFGVDSRPIEPGSIDMPAFERPRQIPPGYRGTETAGGGEYVDAFPYIRRFPFIADFYAANGFTMPP